MRRILFCNNSWMIKYAGYSNDDKAIGGGSYKSEWKHEQFNFMEQDGKYYGYVQPTNNSIDLTKIDESLAPDALEIDNVLVIFTASNPNPYDNSTYVVGWYNNAIVHKYSIPRKGYPHYSYYLEAKKEDCTLLTPSERVNIYWKVRRSPQYGLAYMGRSHIWYAKPSLKEYDQDKVKEVSEHVDKIVKRIEEYIENH